MSCIRGHDSHLPGRSKMVSSNGSVTELSLAPGRPANHGRSTEHMEKALFDRTRSGNGKREENEHDQPEADPSQDRALRKELCACPGRSKDECAPIATPTRRKIPGMRRPPSPAYLCFNSSSTVKPISFAIWRSRMGETSLPWCAGTVVPQPSGCRSCLCQPRCRTCAKPSASRIKMTSRGLKTRSLLMLSVL